MNRMLRPQSIAEVAEWSNSWDEAAYNIQDFLHEFAARPHAAMLTAEPRLLTAVFERGEVADAYLAAVAATLAPTLGVRSPEWAWAPCRYLKLPWFSSPGPSMRACLLLESPARFRERNLFVTANALSVA